MTNGYDAAAQQRLRLSFDLDVDIAIVGAGLAGLTVALEAARLGASIAVLEGRHIGWGASGHHLGTVMPGFGLPAAELIERVGLEDAQELWALSKEGVDYVRATATEDAMPGITSSEGALEVSNVDAGEALISRLQTLSGDLDTEVEGWQVDRVRNALRTDRYFHGIYYPKAFQIDPRKYVHGLAALAHLGAPLRRLSETLLPVWRYAAVSETLGERLDEVIAFKGSVMDSDGIDHFRIVDGDRLMWASPETTWEARPKRFASVIQRRIDTVFPRLGKVGIADVFGGAVGTTVHGMPQVGQLRKGLWVASGFGRQGIATSAMAGLLIARSILWGDERWRLFSPFELVWAGGPTGRVAGHLIGKWARGSSAAVGMLARYRERARLKERQREARLAEANRQAGTRAPPRRRPPPGQPRPAQPPEPAAASEHEGGPSSH